MYIYLVNILLNQEISTKTYVNHLHLLVLFSKMSEIEINKYIIKLHILTILHDIQRHQYQQDWQLLNSKNIV